MTKRLFLLIFLCCLHIGGLTQVLAISQKIFWSGGLLNAVDENQQQFNPAASHPKVQKGFQLYTSAPLQISNLFGLHMSAHYTHNKVGVYHEFNGIFHSAQHQLQTAHALAFTPAPKLKIGIGLSLQRALQPHYYGNTLTASARLGCQYQLKADQFVALVLTDIGRAAQQQIQLEHVLVLDERLSFAQGCSWNPQFKPNLYISLVQNLSGAKVQFTCGLFPQSYAFSIVVSKQKKYTWQLGQSWQKSHGLCFQIGLNLH
jgi:hypothetical protein